MKKFMAAAIQMDSGSDKEKNLNTAVLMVREAASNGAEFIVMPESVNYIGAEKSENAEIIPNGYTYNIFSSLAKELKVWLHCGSIYEVNKEDEKRPYNSTMLIRPDGVLAAKYSKLHAFDVEIENGPCVKESQSIRMGDKIVVLDTQDIGTIGLSICYDMRFGEIYRLMALAGAEVFVVCANFTLNTGKDHWEPILRTRAIENGCYLIAPAQFGIKPKFQANGKSVIIDPWGNIVAQASERQCVITAEIDLDYVQNVRNQTMTLQNRRTDIYNIGIIKI